LYVLAVIGAVAVAEWLLRPLRASLKVRRAADEFHPAYVETLAAIREAGRARAPNHPSVLLALRRWVSARAVIRGLAEDEQRIVAEISARKGVVLAEIVQAITAFMEECGGVSESTPARERAGAMRWTFGDLPESRAPGRLDVWEPGPQAKQRRRSL
jgi:hypothetical protein